MGQNRVARMLCVALVPGGFAACGGKVLETTESFEPPQDDAGVAGSGVGLVSRQDADYEPSGDAAAAILPDFPCDAGDCPADRACNPLTNLCEPTCDVRGAVDPLAPWPMFSGCPTNRGLSRYVGTSTPKVKWSVQVASEDYPGSRTPILGSNGNIYLSQAIEEGGNPALRAFGPDGTPLFTGPSSGFSAPSIASDGTLWLGTRGGLFQMDSSGKRLRFPFYVFDWDYPQLLPDGDILVWAGSLPTTSTPPLLYCRSATGSPLWSFEPTSMNAASIDGTAVGADGTIYNCTEDGALLALAPDGSQRWRASLPCFTPTVAHDGTIYGGSFESVGAVSRAGTLLWSIESDADTPYTSWISIGLDGSLIATQQGENPRVVSFSPQGAVRWSLPMMGNTGGHSRPVIDRTGTIFVGVADGLDALRPDGSMTWSFGDFGACGSPSIGADGTVYVTCGTSLVAIGD
jgi:outer membrane protein assembly factor BamB